MLTVKLNDIVSLLFFKKSWPSPARFLFIFLSFQTNNAIFRTNMRMQCWDLNPQPSGHESPPITTRPVLPPSHFLIVQLHFL